MEETREKRLAQEEVERDSKRSRQEDPEAGRASGSTDERRDISMEVNGLDGEEIEEDELHIASLTETSVVRTAVTGSSKKNFTTTEPGSTWFRAGREGEVGRGRVHGEDRDITECLEMATDQHQMGGCEQGVNGVAGCPMQARGTGISSSRRRLSDRTSSPQCLRWRRRSSFSERRSEGARSCGTGDGASRRSC